MASIPTTAVRVAGITAVLVSAALVVADVEPAATPLSSLLEPITIGTPGPKSEDADQSLIDDAFAAAGEPSAQPATPPPAAPTEPPPPPPDPESFFAGWTGSLEFGLSGASGNTERFALRGAFGAERKTSKTITKFGAFYIYATDDGDKSEDKGQVLLRNDWLGLGDGRVRVYALGQVDYDQFKDWDWRVTFVVGVGYELIKTDSTLFLPRIGLAITKEFGSSDNRIVPELNLGFDFEHKFTATQKFFFIFDSYWSMLDYPEYRIIASTGYEIVVDPTNNLSLKIGALDEYDSTPGEGRNRNDLSYFLTLIWKF